MASLERVGLENIQGGYDMYSSSPYFAIFERANLNSNKTGRLIFAYKEADRDEGWRVLEQNLKALEKTAPTVPHIIQFYDELGRNNSIDDKTPYSGSFVFRMQPSTYGMVQSSISGVQVQDNQFLVYLQQELQEVKQENLELKDRIVDMESELDQADNKGGAPIGGLIGQIGEAGNQFPWMADIIKDIFTVVKHKFTDPGPQRRQSQGGAIAGVPEGNPADVMNQSIRTLAAWYAKEYGTGETEQEKADTGFVQFAKDMHQLSNLTTDSDVMHLALKKLRAF